MAATSLPDLPTEILLEVQTFLSYGSRIALRLTCRDLYAKVDDPNQTTNTLLRLSTSSGSEIKAYSMVDLLEIERWPEYNAAQYRSAESKQPVDYEDFFACCLCLKIRSASKFSNAMMKGKRGKLGNGTIAERIGRFCIKCGLAHGRYHRGVYLQFGGALGGYGFVCHRCGNFEHVRYDCDIQVAKRSCTRCWNLVY
jgi:hypothetical protein